MPDQRELAALLSKHGYSGTKKIGEGSFGVAVLVEDAEKTQAVCKLVDVSRASAKETQEARREARLLSQVKHPYIVRYRENFSERGWLCIVMDFCDGGDLTAQIETAAKQRKWLEESRIMRWFTQATLALKYLHSKHILHRDLKPSNLFLTKKGDLRMGDFGISKVMACTAAFARTFVGTPYYLSPEVITEKPYTWPSDVWSMGCILYHMCALKVPFDATNITGLAQKITKAPVPCIQTSYAEWIRSLQQDMMRRNPDVRPTADAIIAKANIQAVVKDLLSQSQAGKEKNKDDQKPKAKHEVLDQFNAFDQNGDGVIDRQELSRVLKHLDAKVWNDANVDQVILVADTNKDGKIQFDEFLKWIFGSSSGDAGVAAKVDDLIKLANVAVDQEDMDFLADHLVGWRQYVDMGCLRISPPVVSIKTCEAIAWLSVAARSLLETSPAQQAFEAARQLRAILQQVEQLLSESSRQQVSRVAAVQSRAAVRGVVVERFDGLRQGHCPSGLQDADLENVGAKWENLSHGERIIEARGFAVAPEAASRKPSRERLGRKPSIGGPRPKSPEPVAAVAKDDCVAASVTLCTNRGRHLEFGSKMSTTQGAAFSFKAPDGEEIERLIFSGKTCTGIETAPIVVNWSQERAAAVRNAFLSAVQAFWPVLIDLAGKMGTKYSSFALLEGRRLGLKDLTVPALPSVSVAAPKHWSLSIMGGAGPDGAPAADVAEMKVPSAELIRLQGLLNVSFKAPLVPRDAQVVTPSSLQVVRASRLQNWRSWKGYVARQACIREDLARLKEGGKTSPVMADPIMSSHMDSIAGPLDPDANCRWLFHGISAEAQKQILQPDFDIDTAGAEDGMLYGRGIYLTEWCSKVDRTVPEGPEGLRCMLVCRVTLGRLLRDDAVLPDKAHIIDQCTGGSYHSVLGDREERCPGSLRDFVVYDRDQVYPEILLWYRRVYR